MFLQVCPVCEHRNPRGSRFCNECGSPLQLRFCPACHAAADVMALVCGSCGEKLPPIPLADPAESLVDLEPATESIWKSDAPPPGFHFPEDDGVVVTVHGGSTRSPVVEDPPVQRFEPFGMDAPEPRPIPGFESLAPAEQKPEVAPAPAAPAETEPAPATPAESAPKTRHPTIIERLHITQAELDLRPLQIPPLPPAVEPPAPESESGAVLTPEMESEIEVSAEAETLVEASVGPVTYQRPEEISITETAQSDEIASQLREGAWRSAMSIDPSRLTPVVIKPQLPQKRRLSMHRVALAIAAIGAIAAVGYSVRLAPGTGSGSTPVQTAAPQARIAVDTFPPAAGVTATMPDGSFAHSIEPPPPAAPSAAPVAEEPRDKAYTAPHTAPPTTTAQAEPPVAAKPVAPRLPAPPPAPTRESAPPPAPIREPVAPPVAQVRQPPFEAPRPCTSAIAALGLCTLEANQEGK